MKKYNLKNGNRPKATIGAAAAISAGASLAAAAIQAAATRQAAKEQAESMARLNEVNTKNQQDLINFNKQQNEQMRNTILAANMNEQLQAGQQNNIARLEASRLIAKRGGKIKKSVYFLRGKNSNLPFTVTDGGGVIPITTTPEGYDLYEIVGNDHNHYHKTNNGKNKTGVGIKFAGQETIEGEGNQNTNQGELLLVTPTDAEFISKHSIKGFNPAKAVINGMHPQEAFNIQENLKDMDNKTPVKRMRLRYAKGGEAFIMPDYDEAWGDILYYSTNPHRNNKTYNNHFTPNITGSLITAGGNLGGALISTLGNSSAARTLADAYSNLKTIDPNIISKEDYSAPLSYAALQAPIVNTNPQRTLAERSRQRSLRTINNGSLSSAAAQNRSAAADIIYNDQISSIEDKANEVRQGIIQGNMERLTNVSAKNAELRNAALRDYTSARLSLAQYNNDIENQRILGSADTLASSRQQNAQIWGNTLATSAAGVGSAFATDEKQRHELDMTLLGANPENNINYAIRFKDINLARDLYQLYKNSPEGSEQANYAKRLEDIFGADNLIVKQ